jgi:group I intron endonuclease
MSYIYKITNNVNDKIYIGKTEYVKPEERWKQHLREYTRKRCEKRPLYAAMNKYGIEHFHFEVIEETDNPEEREKYWIKNLRTYIGFDDCNGYNATLGGDGSSYLNLDEDKVINKYFELRSSEKAAKYYNVTTKTVLNILHNNNIKVDLLRYPVLKINQVTCEIVEKFEYRTDLKHETGLEDEISRHVLTTVCKPIKGYLWIYEKDYIKLGVDGINRIKEKSEYYGGCKTGSFDKKQVVCINDKKIFESISEGQKYYNIKSNSGICECCSGKKKSCGKHPTTGEKLIWMYYKDYVNMSKEYLENFKNKMIKNNYKNNSKKIICITTLKVFDKIVDASNCYKVDKSSISACCKNKLKTAGKLQDGTKLVWMYYEDYLNLNN